MPSSSPPTSPGSSPSPNGTTIPVLRRKLAAMQTALDEATKGTRKRKITTSTLGRPIRKVVTLFDSLETLIAESDRRLEAEENPDAPDLEPDELLDCNRRMAAFKLLIKLDPQINTLMLAVDLKELTDHVFQLEGGANDARADDVRRIKEKTATWINRKYSPVPPLDPEDRCDRGLQHDVTGRLLCSITHNWDDEVTRTDIRAGEKDASVDFYPRLCYPNSNGDPNDLEKGYLQSELLVKTYAAIFTSPSSADGVGNEENAEPAMKKQKTGKKKPTKKNVASLAKMTNVTPRSIAYSAVLLHFNLTDAGQWCDEYNGFSYRGFYNFIVDFFEDTPDAVSKQCAKKVLDWWDRRIFPNKAQAVASTNTSKDRLNAQRAARSARGS